MNAIMWCVMTGDCVDFNLWKRTFHLRYSGGPVGTLCFRRKNAGPIGSDFLLCLMKDRTGGIWVSSEYSGLSHISISNKGITHVYPESPDVFDRSNTIRLLTKMSNGDIWVGTRRGGLYNYDSHLKTKIDNHYLPYNIYAISEDSQENIWIGAGETD